MTLNTLQRKLALLARPGESWVVQDDALTLVVSAVASPRRRLLTYRLTPTRDDPAAPWRWQEAPDQAVLGLAALAEHAAIQREAVRRGLAPITASGRIFNQGFMLNEHDIAALFRLDLVALEEDAGAW